MLAGSQRDAEGGTPPSAAAPWEELTEQLGIRVLVIANLRADLDVLLA